MRRGFLLPENKKKEVFMLNIKVLAPIERKPDRSLPRMTPRQRQQAVRLIQKVCYNYNDGNCILLDEGETCVCPQSISYSVNCKFFRRVLLEDKEGLSLKAELFRNETTKRCAVCGKAFQSKSNNAKYCVVCAPVIQRSKKLITQKNDGPM